MKQFNKKFIALSIFSAFSTANASQMDSFAELEQAKARMELPVEQKIAEFHQYINNYLDEYEAWREEYNKKLDQQRSKLINQWGSGEISDQSKSVEYTKDNKVKKVVDYQNNTATISVLMDKDADVSSSAELAKQNTIIIDGQKINLAQAEISLSRVDYSSAQEKKEKDFIVRQVSMQIKQLDIQADRLIQSNTGIPDSFIYERAYNKKQTLLDNAKQRLTDIAKLYREKRQELGIESIDLPSDKSITENTANKKNVSNTEKDIANLDKTLVNINKTKQQPHAKVENKSETPKPIETPATMENKIQPNKSSKKLAAKDINLQKKIVSYTVKLPSKILEKRADLYLPLAKEESKRWGIDKAVIMAIMHSESSFRPDAKSHIPAFGLMQIVPVSAGHDVNKRIRNIDSPMKSEELYIPPLNVETGTAYLHILHDKYLKAINDPQSRLYCTIAAYNTGAGNVARAFNENRSTNIRQAAKIINKMQPEQVYQHLLNKLPYDETKNYLKKVNERISLYQ